MSTTVTHAYGLDTTGMHSSQVPATTPRVQRNLVKDIVAQFNQEANKRETYSRQNSYDQADTYSNGYSSHKSSPSPPNLNGNARHIYPIPLNQRSKSELSLTGPPGDGGIVYAQVHVVNGSRNGDAASPNKYKTTVHTVHQPTSHRLGYSNKLAKSTGSLNRSQLNEEDEEEDDRVLNTLNHKSNSNVHSYYRFDDPSNGSVSNGNGHAYGKIVKKRNDSNSDDVFETSTNSRIIPLRPSNGFNNVPTETAKPIFRTKNVEKWSEKEDLPGNRKKYTEHEKVHLVTMSNDTYDGHRAKSTSPLLKSLTKNDDVFGEERRHRDVMSPLVGNNYSKKTSTLEDSKVQRIRTLTPEIKSPRKPLTSGGYYIAQPSAKNVTSRHLVTENFRENEESSWQSRGRRHSTDSGSSGVLLSSRLVKQADAELNDYSPRSPTLPPLVTSTWRRETEADDALKCISPRLRPLSPSSGISSVTSATGGGKETRAEERHFRKQETTKTTKHEEHKGTPTYNRRSRSADRYQHRLPIEINQENEGMKKVEERRSTARRRLDKQFGNYYEEDRMETSGSEAPIYGGSQGSNMSIGSAHDDHYHHHQQHNNNYRRVLNDKENIISAHSNTPTSMLKNANKNALSYENTQRRQSNDTASTSSGRRMWFERVNDEVDDVKLSNSATMSRLETKKNRRNHVSDNEMSVNTVDRRDVMRRRRNKDARHAERAHAHQLARTSSFNSRIDNYHSEMENESQASSTGSKQKRVNFKAANGKSNGFLSPMHREALLRSASPARAPSIASNDSELSNRSVILHATAVADIPAPMQYRQRSANTSPAPSLTGSGDGRSSSMSRRGKQKESRTVQRSFSLLSPWKPRRYKEKSSTSGAATAAASTTSVVSREEKASHSKKQSQESLSHNSSSAERLDSLSPLPSEAVPAKNKKKAGILRRRHSMPKDSRFANFFKRKNKESKKK